MTDAAARAEEWLSGPYDEETKTAIRCASPDEIEAAFGSDLSFGTAGMRGIVGFGPARLNIYTIGTATQGLANYILAQTTGAQSVIIGFDSRLSSPEFAKETARVLSGNGITAYLCPKLMPTPFISFACRHLKCSAAVMITASHNPPEYNGYKVYWSDGAQVVPPHDTGIIEQVRAVRPEHVKRSCDLIQTVAESVEQAYLDAITPLQNLPEQNQAHGDELNIVYTPLHGAGISLMPQAFTAWGFATVQLVQEQAIPDGHFPTTHSPNPESPDALKLGIDQLQHSSADILLANDPDADRLGCVVMHQGQPRYLTGNEIATLCADHLLNHAKRQSNSALVTTIVTTDSLDTLAKAYDMPCIKVLTGFKYIGELIHKWETTHEHTFFFGAEESLGYLIGTHARDKDGIVCNCLLAEMALDAKLANETLIDRLDAIYAKHGQFESALASFTFAGNLDALRKSPPTSIAGKNVLKTIDYLNDETGLPKSNVLSYTLDGEITILIRPSGTEPKLKIYAKARNQTKDTLTALINTIKTDLLDLP